jgi:hypothetical protein
MKVSNDHRETWVGCEQKERCQGSANEFILSYFSAPSGRGAMSFNDRGKNKWGSRSLYSK